MSKINFKEINTKFRKLYIFLILFILSICGVFLILIIVSKWGISLNLDSIAYITGAKNIVNGKGIAILYDETGKIALNLWTPSQKTGLSIFLWPPLYPIVLSIVGLLNINITIGATIINACFFGINIGLFGYLIYYITNSKILTFISSIIFFTSEATLSLHTWALSEPLFIFSLLFSILFLLKFYKFAINNNNNNNNLFSKPKIILYLILSSIFSGLCVLTRYAGIFSVIAPILILILTINKINLNKHQNHFKNSYSYQSNYKDKKITSVYSIIKGIKNQKIAFLFCLIYFVISIIPILIWIIQLRKIKESVRELSFYPINLNDLKNTFSVITKWFLNFQVNWPFSFIIFLALLLIAIFIFLYSKKNQKKSYFKNNFTFDQIKKIKLINISYMIFTIYIASYILILITSRIFFEGGFIIAQNRLLSPIFILSVILIILIFFSWLSIIKNKLAYTSVILILIIFISSNIFNTTKWAINRYYSGQGYSQSYFLNSETIKFLKKLPENIEIYSNGPDLIYYLTKKPAKIIPRVQEKEANINRNSNFDTLESFKDAIKKNNNIIVYFNGISRKYLFSIEDLKKNINLYLYKKFSDGNIYKAIPNIGKEILKTNYKNFKDFWIIIADCSFEIQNNKILIKSTGDDPSFFCYLNEELKEKKPIILQLNLYSDIENKAVFFYAKKNEDFSDNNSDEYPIAKGYNSIHFFIPSDKNIDKIRIDPVDIKKDIYIDSIIFYQIEN